MDIRIGFSLDAEHGSQCWGIDRTEPLTCLDMENESYVFSGDAKHTCIGLLCSPRQQQASQRQEDAKMMAGETPREPVSKCKPEAITTVGTETTTHALAHNPIEVCHVQQHSIKARPNPPTSTA